MKITILSVGSRGDIQPLVALGKELKVMGANVLFSSHLQYRSLVVDNNLEFFEMPKNPVKKWEKSRDNSQGKSETLWAQIEPDMIDWLETGLKICKDSDAIIFNALYSVGQHLGEKLNIPYFSVIFEPSIPTGAFPTPYFPFQKNMGALINQFTYFIGSQIFWRQIRKQLNHFRKERLGLDSISWRGPINKMLTEENPNLCCFSTHLVKKPSNWHNNIFISGYWFLKMEKEFIPTTNLAEFLKNGEAPIFFDFGSFANDMMDKKIKIILNDIIKSGERLIIAAGKIDPLKYDLPEQTYILEENVPHEWLLTKLKAIIAHGGVGVTHAVLRAGIPMIPISIFAAQFYWGKKLFDLGLAAKPLKIRKLQVGDVYNSIIYLRNNEKLLNNLTEFKKLILEENGEQKAANWIFDFLSKK